MDYKILVDGLGNNIDYMSLAIRKTPRLLLIRTTMTDLIESNPKLKEFSKKRDCKLITVKLLK